MNVFCIRCGSAFASGQAHSCSGNPRRILDATSPPTLSAKISVTCGNSTSQTLTFGGAPYMTDGSGTA